MDQIIIKVRNSYRERQSEGVVLLGHEIDKEEGEEIWKQDKRKD